MKDLIYTFGHLQIFGVAEDPYDLECFCLVVHCVCNINTHHLHQCKQSFHYSSISIVMEGSWSSPGMKKNKKTFFKDFPVDEPALHMTTRWQQNSVV